MRSVLLLLASLLWIGGGCASPIATSRRPTPAMPHSGVFAGTEGAGTEGAETEGAETEGAETEGAETEGAETGPAEAPITRQTAAMAWLERVLYPKQRVWRSWGEQHLQTGDLVFTRGNYYLLLGAINFSSFLSTVSESPFSHVGIVAIEDGQPVVYDISDAGVGRTPFAQYVTRSGYETVAVRRPVPELYASVPAAIEFVRQQRADSVKFDDQFRMGNDSRYCSEFVIDAYAVSGAQIAEPVLVGDLPGLARVHPFAIQLARMATGLGLDDPVYPLGNASSGLYGSPLLVECLPPTEI